MSRSGVIKRADTGMFISLDDIHVKKALTNATTTNAPAWLMMLCLSTS
jgi:hypothetical protein